MQTKITYLKETKISKQLVVDGEPYLILGAELQNSSLSSAAYMKTVWAKLKAANINTLLGAVTWEQIEPVEGQFDFKELDKVLVDARSHGFRLVLLWFGSFKNGLSTYTPEWVKTNPKRFPRAQLRKAGGRLETGDVLSIFGKEAQAADARAFKMLMTHLKEVDEKYSTVLMVQVENEIGLLGDSRDGGPLANARFSQPVPNDLLEKLITQWDSLHETFKVNFQHLKDKKAVRHGTWTEVFGDSPLTDELFMAYHYCLYVEEVASAGKAIYPIPIYTNVWQNYATDVADPNLPVVVGGGGTPGVYPSGGAVVNVLDIWQLFCPSLDFIAPDIYLNDYSNTCVKYRHRNQPLFIPEQRRDEYGARRIWKAFGSYQCLGTCPFGIDTLELEDNPYRKHYGLLTKVSKHILAAHSIPDSSFGFFFDETATSSASEVYWTIFGPWKLKIERSFVFGKPSAGSGMVIHQGDDKFLLLGWGFQVTFQSTNPKAHFTGILSFQEKETDPVTGELITARFLNGDETRSGSFVIMPSEDPDYGGFPISITIPARTGIATCRPYALVDED